MDFVGDDRFIELWDLYNEKRELVGIDIVRSKPIPHRCYHLVVHVWIRNKKGEYLISQISPHRPTFPLMWECVGGSVIKGESNLEGAIRKAKEEIGVTLYPESGKLIFSTVGRVINAVNFPDILDVCLFEHDGKITLKQATTNEVSQVLWMKKDQIRKLFNMGTFVHTLAYFFEDFFEHE